MNPSIPSETHGPSQQFRFEFKRSYAWVARVFGIFDATAVVTVTGTQLLARFGPWHVRTDLDNIVSTEFSGPFAYPKTAGPAHLSFSDRGLTFATTNRQGLMIRFRRPIRGLDPFGVIRHPNLTVTVCNREALAIALQPHLATPPAAPPATVQAAE